MRKIAETKKAEAKRVSPSPKRRITASIPVSTRVANVTTAPAGARLNKQTLMISEKRHNKSSHQDREMHPAYADEGSTDQIIETVLQNGEY